MSRLAKQTVKLEIALEDFIAAMDAMWKETDTELEKILIAGAAVYATAAARHTPPDIGKTNISPLYYVNGVWLKDTDEKTLKGRRPVYDLLSLVRTSNSRYKSFYGKLLRQGYYYMVKIMRPGKPVVTKYCRSLAEAERYAEISYRGITRAAWGLRVGDLSGHMPPAFKKYIAQRPKIAGKSALNVVSLNRKKRTVTLVNQVASGSYLTSTNTNASIAALKTMTERIKKFLQKKYNI